MHPYLGPRRPRVVFSLSIIWMMSNPFQSPLSTFWLVFNLTPVTLFVLHTLGIWATYCSPGGKDLTSFTWCFWFIAHLPLTAMVSLDTLASRIIWGGLLWAFWGLTLVLAVNFLRMDFSGQSDAACLLLEQRDSKLKSKWLICERHLNPHCPSHCLEWVVIFQDMAKLSGQAKLKPWM